MVVVMEMLHFNFTGDKPEVHSDETYILAQWFDETGADYTYINCFW
ncbi:hypothetical protein MBGDF03_01116 [Thermoplasmatales archaeon SCGC AB-540-F20]|nr:hypothetical protein MBGDF03_01116 [Thermoplasmatales archaeon SCGC AB-540-F20]